MKHWCGSELEMWNRPQFCVEVVRQMHGHLGEAEGEQEVEQSLALLESHLQPCCCPLAFREKCHSLKQSCLFILTAPNS